MDDAAPITGQSLGERLYDAVAETAWDRPMLWSALEPGTRARFERAATTFASRLSFTEIEGVREALLSSVLLEALKGVRHWASRRCPCGPPDYPPDEPKVCPLCDAGAEVPGDRCKAVEAIFPRALLRTVDAAIAQAEAAAISPFTKAPTMQVVAGLEHKEA